MKNITLLFFTTFLGLNFAYSQVEIVDGFKTKISQSTLIGNNNNYCVYAKFDSPKSPKNITYTAYNYATHKIIEEKVKAPRNNKTGRIFHKIKLVNNDIYELHLGAYQANKGRQMTILKRKLNNLSANPKTTIIGDLNVLKMPSAALYFNESAKYVVCTKNHTKKGDFILALNDDLTIEKRIDLSAFYPENLKWGFITKFQLQSDGNFVLSVLLDKMTNEDFGVEDPEGDSNLGFLIIKPDGEKLAVRTEIKADMKYSSMTYSYNEIDNTIEAFFSTVNDDKEGVFYYAWDVKTGAIKKSFSNHYLISDLATPDVIDFYNKIKSKDIDEILANKSQKISKLNCGKAIYFLKNNEFLVVYNNFYLNDGITSYTNTYHHSILMVKFNSNGEKEWVNFQPSLSDEKNSLVYDKKNNMMIILSTGREINYPNGVFNDKYSKKGKINVFALAIVDVNLGEFIKREKIATIDNSFFRAKFDSEKDQINIMLTKVVNTSSKTRELKFTTIEIDEILVE